MLLSSSLRDVDSRDHSLKNRIMKILSLIFPVALVTCLSSAAWSTSATDVKSKAGATVDAAGDYTKEQKDAFVKEMEGNLATLKAKINKMKSNADHSKDAAVLKLEKDQKDLETNISEMKKSSGKAWGKLKTGMSKAWSEVKNSLNDAKDELKK